jgi:hypothetical protein
MAITDEIAINAPIAAVWEAIQTQPSTPVRSSRGSRVVAGGYLVTGRAQRAQPFAQPRPTGTYHYQRVRPAGHENVEDLGKREQLAADRAHVVAAL